MTKYEQRFDKNDSLAEQVNYEARQGILDKTTRIIYSYRHDTLMRCKQFSLYEWDEKTKTWQYAVNNEECFTRDGKELYLVRGTLSSNDAWDPAKKKSLYWWSLSKIVTGYNSHGDVISKYTCDGYCTSSSGVITFKNADTVETDGAIQKVHWSVCTGSDFIYDSSRRLSMKTFSIGGKPAEKDSFVYENGGLKRLRYYADAKKGIWIEPLAASATYFDSLGNIILEEEFKRDSKAVAREEYNWDERKNEIYYASFTLDTLTGEWRPGRKVRRNYKYDMGGRLLEFKEYELQDDGSPTLTLQEENTYYKNGKRKFQKIQRLWEPSYEAAFDANGNILKEVEAGIVKKYYYRK